MEVCDFMFIVELTLYTCCDNNVSPPCTIPQWLIKDNAYFPQPHSSINLILLKPLTTETTDAYM